MATLAAYAVSTVLNDYRSTGSTYGDVTGTLQDAGPNTLLNSYDTSTLVLLGYACREQRVNLITNPRGVGAVAGTPGTMPTNWGWSLATSGLSTAVVGSGTENGFDFVDHRLYGTSGSSLSNVSLFFESQTNIPVVPANAYSYELDFYVKLAAGTQNGVSSFTGTMTEVPSSGLGGTSDVGPTISLTGTRARIPTMVQLINAGTTSYLRPGIRMTCAASTAIDITIRIYTPQLQRGTFSASLIRPAVGATGATTRGADDLRLSLQPAWLDGVSNTFLMECTIPQAAPTGQQLGLYRFDDGTEANKLIVYVDAGTSNVKAQLTIGGTLLGTVAMGSMIAGTIFRAVVGYSVATGTGAGTLAGIISGGSRQAVTFTVPAAPAAFARALMGRSSLNAGRFIEDGALHMNGHYTEFTVAKGSVLSEDAMLYLCQLNQSVGVLLTNAGTVLGS